MSNSSVGLHVESAVYSFLKWSHFLRWSSVCVRFKILLYTQVGENNLINLWHNKWSVLLLCPVVKQNTLGQSANLMSTFQVKDLYILLKRSWGHKKKLGFEWASKLSCAHSCRSLWLLLLLLLLLPPGRRHFNVEQTRPSRATRGEVTSCHVDGLVLDWGVGGCPTFDPRGSGDSLRALCQEQMSLERVKEAEQWRWRVWACFLKEEEGWGRD